MEKGRSRVWLEKTEWGLKYTIGGQKKGELLPPEQAQDIIKRFEHEQVLFIAKKKK